MDNESLLLERDRTTLKEMDDFINLVADLLECDKFAAPQTAMEMVEREQRMQVVSRMKEIYQEIRSKWIFDKLSEYD